MTDHLGDISLVWSWQAFVFAGVAGFVVGYVSALVFDGPKWRSQQPPGLVAWATSLAGATAMLVLVMSQVVASIAEGDPLWTRVLSRLFPFLFGGVCIGVGVGVRLWQERK